MFKNVLPMQFLGPAEKGTYAYGWRFIEFSKVKRSGSNFSGFGKISSFLCSMYGHTIKVALSGIGYPPEII